MGWIPLVLAVLNIGLSIFGWFWGKKLEREKRAKEIVELFGKITKEGDVLAIQIRNEMSKHSDQDWGDIKPRNP
jgi:hypothetical protein